MPWYLNTWRVISCSAGYRREVPVRNSLLFNINPSGGLTRGPDRRQCLWPDGGKCRQLQGQKNR